MYRSLAGMLVAAFVAPYLAGSLFPAAAAASGASAAGAGAASAAAVSTAGVAAGTGSVAAGTVGVAASTAGAAASMGFGYVVTTGVIAGGISSAIAGNNVLKGAALGGLFAGFGFGVDGILGEFIKSSELLRESLSVAATASLSTVIYKGNLLDNVLASVGANVAASLIVPMPKFANKELTKQQVNAINNRQVMRAFTRGMTASVISKDSNLGMSLITAGISGLQSWVGHQANIYAQQRRVTQQPAPIRDTNKPMIFSNKQATRPTPMPNSAGTGDVNRSSTSGGRVGRYKINLPEFEHPCASAFRPRLPTMIPRIDPTIDKNYATVSSMPDLPVQTNFELNVGTRALGLLQAAGGAVEFSVSLAGGAMSLETVIGPIIAAGYATIGIDNVLAGARAFVTGRHQPTLLFQAARGIGLSDTAAMWFEFGANLGPSVHVMMREVGNIAAKGGAMLRLYDLRKAKPPVVNYTEASRVFRKTNDLLGVESASEELIKAIRRKGRVVEIIKPGTDEYAYMELFGFEANCGGENLTHILVRENPSKVALLEEFLHGTQSKAGIINKFTIQHSGDAQAGMLEAEKHVKNFMIKHKDLLKLWPEDVEKLEQLYILEGERLNAVLQRRFK